ncbi:MAG: hypothetical protein JO257_07860 [Deltaproteobacteria bacterium]|nr:hypothetical protein [Deltaproteobacteria bacterium]
MTTPNYIGRGRPSPENDGWLGSWFGGTPAYRGVGQPAQKASSMLGGSQPAYQPGPAVQADPNTGSDVCGPFAIVIPRQVIESQQ